ncbi:hypothetical protein [Synechococcus sp. WH 8016]|uniref:hypothetical protein n=1 Tax=Synechococcus sp. WH 8016 TaxID=166318 RepID=UPI00131F048D|nr:hypothetical protein [Synechococcus sp. WH 8016]
MNDLGGGLNRMDDRVQEFARNTYGRMGNYVPEGARGYLDDVSELIHKDRSGFDNSWQGKTALYGTRALQAGGITAAGAGLIDLTHAMASTFGGPADDAGPNTLPM